MPFENLIRKNCFTINFNVENAVYTPQMIHVASIYRAASKASLFHAGSLLMESRHPADVSIDMDSVTRNRRQIQVVAQQVSVVTCTCICTGIHRCSQVTFPCLMLA